MPPESAAACSAPSPPPASAATRACLCGRSSRRTVAGPACRARRLPLRAAAARRHRAAARVPQRPDRRAAPGRADLPGAQERWFDEVVPAQRAARPPMILVSILDGTALHRLRRPDQPRLGRPRGRRSRSWSTPSARPTPHVYRRDMTRVPGLPGATGRSATWAEPPVRRDLRVPRLPHRRSSRRPASSSRGACASSIVGGRGDSVVHGLLAAGSRDERAATGTRRARDRRRRRDRARADRALLAARRAGSCAADLKPRPDWLDSRRRLRRGRRQRPDARRSAPRSSPSTASTLRRRSSAPTETEGFWEENHRHNVELSHHVATLARGDARRCAGCVRVELPRLRPGALPVRRAAERPTPLARGRPVRPRNLCGGAKLMHEQELEFLRCSPARRSARSRRGSSASTGAARRTSSRAGCAR